MKCGLAYSCLCYDHLLTITLSSLVQLNLFQQERQSLKSRRKNGSYACHFRNIPLKHLYAPLFPLLFFHLPCSIIAQREASIGFGDRRLE